ncbi:glycosyltransferase [Altererythrobacter xixiisoli]|uniref:Glycosyltransferase n=1 Tax=Croceibacterium xixiisoli TaxID=1476466 RepID=A0A6I4U0Q9_9SPHN|nr:glycosyltransferase [Croceibacterium xixiisoli]MXP00910.1 glycosyltransferase [Croceibacterium xixiisoli]
MSAPAISVAMSVYNGERFLREAIESILGQTFGDFEFLILDDGSRDGSRDIYESYAARDSRIRTIVRDNRGLIVSLNQLLDEAAAPVIARMDADDICDPTRFAKQIAFLNANPDYGVIGSWTADINEFGASHRLEGFDHPTNHQEFLQAVKDDGPLLCHPVVTYRRDVVRNVGGYHAAFRHCEDYDLWLRLASVTKLANIPERLIRYRHYEGQVSARHATEQKIGHTVALWAYHERAAGRPDPTQQLTALPEVGQFDEAFHTKGLDWAVRERLAKGLQYSPSGLRGDGFEMMLDYLRDGGSQEGMWRTVLRLVRYGEPLRAARLAATLSSNRPLAA